MKTLPNAPREIDEETRKLQSILYRARQDQLMPSYKGCNMSISHRHRFIWFQVAKVGTQTILNLFKERDITLDVEEGCWLFYPLNSFRDYFKFAFVRNPWDRLASCWRDKIINQNHYNFEPALYEKLQDFDYFIDYIAKLDISNCDHHVREQTSLVDLNEIHFLGRMERFNNDLEKVLEILNIENASIDPKNVTRSDTVLHQGTDKKQTYQSLYSDEQAEKVEKIYQRDIQILGYTFD